MNASQLMPGEKAEVIGFSDDYLALVLNDMGLFLGELIELSGRAPLGDPLCIRTDESLLSIRLSQAKQIIVKKVV